VFDYKKKNKRIEELEVENARLQDELESLWFILDEMAAADIANYSELLDDIVKQRQQDALMATSVKAEC
jgi:predicted DNA-binding ribbon-helix-helix protein|tara:strand:- start:199 stop:405 length:207 start_codon:yes stop_codon:yes gene_type:complete